MSTTTILAISTPVVAIAGFFFSYLSSSRDRRAARDLAGDSYEHEMDVRRRERAYEARKEAYRLVLRWAFVKQQQIELAHYGAAELPFDAQPPEDVSQEFWNAMSIEVAAFGSPRVTTAIEEFRRAWVFFTRASISGTDSGPDAELTEWGLSERNKAADVAYGAYERLTAAINDDLTTL